MLDSGLFAVDGLMNGLFLFFRKGETIWRACEYRFGIDSGTLSRVEGRDDDTGVFAIKEDDTKALVAADLFEGIETDHMRLVKALEAQLSQTIRYFEELLDFLVEFSYFGELIFEDCFQITAIFPGKKGFLLGFQSVNTNEEKNHEREEEKLEDDNRQCSPEYERGGRFNQSGHDVYIRLCSLRYHVFGLL